MNNIRVAGQAASEAEMRAYNLELETLRLLDQMQQEKDSAAALVEAKRRFAGIKEHQITDLARAWDAGWAAGKAWGYWAEREDVSDAADIDGRANPYRTDAPQKGSK